MKKENFLLSGFLGLAIASTPCGAQSVATSAKAPAVFPRTASSLAPIALGDLVVKALPSIDRMDWDHLQIPQVRWLTEGIEHSRTSYASRLGLSRVRASRAVTMMLRQRWEELAWSVELSTEGNTKWGATSLIIRPGFDNSQFKGDYICFGEGFKGCAFPISSLASPRLKLVRQCETGQGANVSLVMAAKTSDGRRGTVIYAGSGGSGGFSNHVEISTMTPQEYCKKYKNRDY